MGPGHARPESGQAGATAASLVTEQWTAEKGWSWPRSSWEVELSVCSWHCPPIPTASSGSQDVPSRFRKLTWAPWCWGPAPGPARCRRGHCPTSWFVPTPRGRSPAVLALWPSAWCGLGDHSRCHRHRQAFDLGQSPSPTFRGEWVKGAPCHSTLLRDWLEHQWANR